MCSFSILFTFASAVTITITITITSSSRNADPSWLLFAQVKQVQSLECPFQDPWLCHTLLAAALVGGPAVAVTFRGILPLVGRSLDPNAADPVKHLRHLQQQAVQEAVLAVTGTAFIWRFESVNL